MNRNKSPNNENQTNTKKRRQKSPETKETQSEKLDKSKLQEEDDEDDEEQEEFRNRKSLRIKNKSQSVVTSSALSTRKSKDISTSGPVSVTKQKVTSTSSSVSSVNSSTASDRKLNGAQFVAAAAAGNFNVSASIGSTSITIDSNSNQDLTQLNHNVEILTKTLAQHSVLLKQLNGSIEKLSSKLEQVKSNSKRMSASSSASKSKQQSSKQASKRAKHNDVEMNDSLDERITLDDSQAEDEDTNAVGVTTAAVIEDDDDEHETINNKSQLAAQQQHQLQLQNDTKKETNENCSLNENTKSPIKQQIVLSSQQTSPQPQHQQQLQLQVNDLNNSLINETVTTQTVKLTNIDTLGDENPRQSSNSFYYLSDSSKSDDDDDDEDDEDDRENLQETQSSQDGKKSRRSSQGQKTKAILNKTKIDTEFISKLIANKDPNDKRYDPNEINKLRLLSHSYQNFAVKLLIRLFDEDEIIGRNVYGRNYSGDKSFMKQPLDPERINFIKETVLKLTKTNNPELAWASCVIAMNRKMVDINNKFIKNHKNNIHNTTI